jgi:Tfp pilus assembly protein PilN
VNTTAATSALNRAGKLFWPSAGGAALACILLVNLPARRRRWQSMLGILALFFSITCSVVALGGYSFS